MKYVDVVVIATPDNAHYELLKQLVNYSLKLVICEKPLTTDLNEAREIVGLYKEREIPIMVNYTRRYVPFYDYLKSHGKPLYGECCFNRGWLHTATHAIDFFNMVGCDNYRIFEYDGNQYERYWDIFLAYRDHSFSETRKDGMPVWSYMDKTMWNLAENAHNFLEGKEPIKCAGDDALLALEKCYELMKGSDAK